MNEQEKEKQIKEEMHDREQPDSFSIEQGSAAKGTKIALKCYFDVLDVAESDDKPQGTAEKKVENLLKLRALLIKKGLMS